MTFGIFLDTYFIFIFIMVILLYTIIFNRGLYEKVKGRFITLISLVVIETIASAVEVYFGRQPDYSIWRKIFSVVCYILRPTIMYTLLLIITRNDSRRKRILYGIPLFITSIILIVDIPFKAVFYYTPDNRWGTGPLFPVTYIVLFIYLAMILVMTFLKVDFKLGFSELITVFIGVAFIVANILGERMIGDIFSGHTQDVTALAVLIYAIHFKNIEDRREKRYLETIEQKTGLLNENACVSKLDQMRQTAQMETYAAVYFDLARFGLINDQYGMEIGNRVLIEYAKTINSMMRNDEILARQGGDRFAAVLLQRNLDVLLGQLSATRIKFIENFKEYDMNISAHVGVYLIESNKISGEEIISNAYSALNYGKAAGNNVTYMTAELRNLIRDEKQFASDIPIAMTNNEFIAYYQPKVNSRTGNLCGAEALVRWSRNGQLVPPGKFIPILETKDLMCDMDFYMLRHVCADIARWIEQGLVPPTISVNFSRRNLSNDHLAADIDAIVQEYHVPKKMIEIEITETIDEFPISVLKGFVDDLHKLGYKVAVDDFGSGSSSLSLLREVSFDTLKIDKGFVDRAYAKDLTILSYMIKLARALGVETLAEGVEQKEQVDTLLSLGCEVIQGYYYDRPLPKDNFETRIMNRRYKVGQD